MNDKGEKTCPLCAEEMDLTDQHLKPCKCGYQICVWCWHHIIEMAEKDRTEGRCPACRTTYDKEKIVGMTVCSERFAELNIDRKKSQKVKPKASEGRKELNGVRVIQRNLVYVMSLPLDLADEDLFQRREYFGQYGKVLKVAMSRTASGAVQRFPNNTCSVFITYSKEEEAIRCIRSVHAFILDGRSLKACFGTMKYCHAWLRNMPCTNAECLYLHEIGAQEDSFTKDETISEHMRKILQQITGTVANFPRRSGSMLPPPVDDYVDNESIPKSVFNVTMNDKGEKTCPLCAEEMDLTDQHLKPCKCGYQMCVWCWHQIIETAEKDKTEGRCPACRTPYEIREERSNRCDESRTKKLGSRYEVADEDVILPAKSS